MKLSVIAFVAVAVLCGGSALLFGQPSTVQSLGFLSQNYRSSTGRRVSDDGSVIVGTSNSVNNKIRGFRWTAEGGMQELAPISSVDESQAYGVSGDGSIVVGFTDGSNREPRAVRWLASGERQEVFVPPSFYQSYAYGISGDGNVAVGTGRPTIDFISHAFKFGATSAPYDLGSINGNGDRSFAYDASRDGRVIVGYGRLIYDRERAFRWTPETGVEDLGTLQRDSYALAVSDDGNVIVGRSPLYSEEEYTFVWNRTTGMQPLPTFAGVLPIGSANDVSGDGSVIVGRGLIPPALSFAERGAACVWRNGQIRSLWDLLQHEYPADLTGWSTFDSIEGISADGTTVTGYGLYLGDRTAFRVVFRNSAPTIDSVAPQSVECEGDANLVTLATAVADNGNRVTIRWKVNGETIQTQTDVMPGATAFEYDFPHGTSNVVVEATDGEFTATAGTTVTVSDTTAPTLIVAADVVVPTDAGTDFATNVTLPPPQVYDVCDGEPTLSNDAPALFAVGETTVLWTATDADGHRSTTDQRVVVEDRERPTLAAIANVNAYCDRGEVFATLRLTPPTAADNVTEAVIVKSDATRRFRIGKTRVTWTATDEAGNSAKKSMIVNVVNRKPQANAGSRVMAEAKTERGVRVRLNGVASSDPDGHSLKYFWRAPGVLFANPNSPKPIGFFPVGVTTATLTVSDAAGAKSSSKVRVVVTLANSEERPRGAQANRAFDDAAGSAHRAAAAGSADAARFLGLSHAAEAQRLGVLAGERAIWDEDGSPREALLEYAALRAEQRNHGEFAAQAWLRAYAASGDQAALASAIDALRGVGCAGADLSNR